MLKVCGEALSILTVIYVARSFPLAESGFYLNTLNALFLFGGLSTLGFGTAFARFVPIYRNAGDVPSIKGLYRRVLYWSSPAMAAAAFVLAIQTAYSVGASSLVSADVGLLSVAVILWALMVLHREFLRANGDTFRSDASFQVIRPALSLLSLALLPAFMPDSTAIALSFLLPLFLVLLHDALRVRSHIGTGPSRLTYARAWRQSSRHFTAFTLGRLVLERFDILVVAAISGLGAAALYGVAARLAILPTFLVDPVRSVFRPRASLLASQDDFAALQRDLTRGLIWIITPGLFVTTCLLVQPQFWLGLFGEEYRSISLLMAILLIGRLAGAYGALSPMALMMGGYERLAATASLIIHVVLFPISLVALTYLFGLYGAATATALAWTVSTIATGLLAQRFLGLRAFVLPTISNMRAALTPPTSKSKREQHQGLNI